MTGKGQVFSVQCGICGEQFETRYFYRELCDPCADIRAMQKESFRHLLQVTLPGLSERVRNVLVREGKAFDFSITRLWTATDSELLDLRMLGPRGVAEIRTAMRGRPIGSWVEHGVMACGNDPR